MSVPRNIELNVKGNFSGNLVVGDHNIVVNNPNGGVVNIVAPPTPAEPRTRPVNLRPRNFPDLLDRVPEIDAIANAIRTSNPVAIFGESGMGKTSLLRKSAHLDDSKIFQDGVIYLNARESARDDLLQTIHDSFFIASPEIKPTDGEIRSKLKDIRSLVILDDVTLGRDDVSYILDVMPKSSFLFASADRVLWGEGLAISLDGLPEGDALQLFQRELGRPLTDDEKPIGVQICRMLLTHPLRILQTASMIREDGLSVPQAFHKLTTTRTQSPTVEMAIQKSSDTQKKIFSLLAVAGGFWLPRDHMLKMISAANFDAEVKSLVARGFIAEQGTNLRMSTDAASSLANLWDLTGWEDALVEHFAGWLQTGPQDILVDQASDLLFHLLKRLGEKKQWSQLVTLGKALERISIMQKKWQRWSHVLSLLRVAARALADKKLEGWVFHQLGTRSMCLGAKMEAQNFLKQALDIRSAIGDKAGVQVTQHNLSVLMNIPMPAQHVKSGSMSGSSFTRWLLLAAAGGGTGIILLVLGFLGYQYLKPPAEETQAPISSPTPSATFTSIPPSDTVTPTGTQPPTNTPSPTLTATSEPVVLFDFVNRASDPDVAYYQYIETNYATPNALPSEPMPLEFQRLDTDITSPWTYVFLVREPFVGWQAKINLEDSSTEDLALAMYMSSGTRARGVFNVPFALRRGDEFVAKVGHLNPTEIGPGDISDKDGVTYRLYYFEKDIGQAVLLGEIRDYMDGKTHEWRIAIPSHLDGVRVRFMLEVDSNLFFNYDYAAWLDAILIGSPR